MKKQLITEKSINDFEQERHLRSRFICDYLLTIPHFLIGHSRDFTCLAYTCCFLLLIITMSGTNSIFQTNADVIYEI